MWYTSRKSKIDQLGHRFCLIQQDVLKFNISMRHIPLMAVINALYDLCPQKFGFQLRHLPIWLHFQVAVQTAPIHILHDNEHLFMTFESLIKLGYVGMVQFLHDFHLPFDWFPPIWLQQLNFIIDFNSDFLVQYFV